MGMLSRLMLTSTGTQRSVANGRWPTADDRPLMASVAAWLFVVGALLTLVVLALPHSPEANELGLLAVSAGCLAGAAVILLRSDRLSLHAYEAIALYATLLATAARLFGENHGPAGAGVQALYLWIALYAFYFFSRRAALVQVAVIGILYGAVLLVEVNAGQAGSSAAVTLWTVTIIGFLAAGWVVAFLRDRVSELIRQLELTARCDSLTGLLNRRGFGERFEDELARARRAECPLGVVVGDLDWFKQVNDRHGHATGDLALVNLARLLEDEARQIDSVGRLGGEEFAILLPDTDQRGAFGFAERLRKQVRMGSQIGGMPLTISFGVVSYPAHGEHPEALFEAADQALYMAKQGGRDRSVLAGPGAAAAI